MQRAAAKAAAEQEAAAASERATEAAAKAEEAKAAKQARIVARRAARKAKAQERQAAKKAAKARAAREQDTTKQHFCKVLSQVKTFQANTLKFVKKPKQMLRHQVVIGIQRHHYLKASKRPNQPSAALSTVNGDDAASQRVPEPEQNNATEDATRDDDWLSDDIRNEIQKLEELALQLDRVVKPAVKAEAEQPSQRPKRVVKPEVSQELEQLCWRLNAQQTGSSGVELEPERAEDTNNAIATPLENPKSETIETPEQKAPNLIPPKQPPPVRDKNRSMCEVRGCKRHFRGCRTWRNHSGPCEGVLDIGYLCIQPRAWIRVPRTTTVPILGPLWVCALAGQYGMHMGRQACRAGNNLAIGSLRIPGVPANILCTRIWGIDG